MIYLGVNEMCTENHAALIDAAKEMMRHGGVRKEMIMEGLEGITFMLEGRNVHVLAGPDGTVEFWCAEPSVEFVDESPR